MYPILYCYRHAIELCIKHLLFQIPRFFDEPLAPDELISHSLERWWNKLIPYLNRLRDVAASVYPDDARSQRILEEQLECDVLSNIGSIILEVHSLDARSTTFRYALDKDGNVPLAHMQHIVLDNLYRFMLPVHVWLEEIIYHSDVLAGPTPGLEPNWLRQLEPLRS